ncbi:MULTISPECIES: phosphomannomutase/phosphoglucomutase [unclassified Kitasatospora]|uniref:phosphomannomutase/phosphoglucomutase n=1 Tax=unclassified Kitasatospora TaxID=2633591 RepID=UPI0038146F91
MSDYARLVKAYDIRGEVPAELDGEVAERIGGLFIRFTNAPQVVVARDMRPSSAMLVRAFSDGARRAGADVIDAGLGSTDYLYYASGSLGLPGAMITASHNPAKDNGIKLCLSGAAPLGENTGLGRIRDWLVAGERAAPAASRGTRTERPLLKEYAAHLRQLVDLTGIRPLRVVADAGNGMAGLTAPEVFAGLPVDLVPLYFELDGTFPHHEANPIDPRNLVDLQAEVRRQGADIGLAFDGDADRCFFVDEGGQPVSPSAVISLIAGRELARHPGSAIVYNLITAEATVRSIRRHGGRPFRSRVGHSHVKALMAQHNAVFGGEHSGHYFFRDFWRADSGMLAALHVLAALGGQDRPLSAVIAAHSRFALSGELNCVVADVPATIREVEERYRHRAGVTTDRLDGLTVGLPGGSRFNLRPSNTEPVLRVNVEAHDQETMEHLRDEVLALIRP